MKVNHNQINNRPLHIFELIRMLYPKLHPKMVEVIDRNDQAYKKTLEDISKLNKAKW
jgi:hypothetical protein